MPEVRCGSPSTTRRCCPMPRDAASIVVPSAFRGGGGGDPRLHDRRRRSRRRRRGAVARRRRARSRCRSASSSADETLERARGEPVVGVEEGDERRVHEIETRVAGGAEPDAVRVAHARGTAGRRRRPRRRSAPVASVEASSIEDRASSPGRRLRAQRVQRVLRVRSDVVTGHDDGDRGGGRLTRPIVRRRRMPRPRRRRHPAARVSACGNVNRTAVCATSGAIPIASSTCEGSSLPAAHADPLEETTPRRSSSSRTASPLVPANVKLAVPGRRCTGSPVSARGRHARRARAR